VIKNKTELQTSNLNTFVRQFHTSGFVVIPSVFALSEIADLRSKLRHYIDEIVPQLSAGEVYYEDVERSVLKALHNLDRHSPHFRDLRDDARLKQIAEAMVGAKVIAGGCSLFAKDAGFGSVTPPHQDQAFQFWEPSDALTLTIAIDESSAENGRLICLRRSHRLGLLRHVQSGVLGFSRRLEVYPPDGDAEEVGLSMKPGDISVHHVLTIHRSEANHSSRSRWQFGIGYHSVGALRDVGAFEVYLRAIESLHESEGRISRS
jgi:phytanoyl-CoA hydroxylase